MARPLVGLQALEEPKLGKEVRVDVGCEGSGATADEGTKLGWGEPSAMMEKSAELG